MTQILLAATVLLEILSLSVYAQDRPDFSGRWTIVPERSVIEGVDGPIDVLVFGPDFTVQMDSDALVLAIAVEWPVKWSVDFSGSSTQHVITADGKTVRTTITAKWEGERLTLFMDEERRQDGRLVQNRTWRRLSLNPDHTLTVEAPWGQSVYRWLEPMPALTPRL